MAKNLFPCSIRIKNCSLYHCINLVVLPLSVTLVQVFPNSILMLFNISFWRYIFFGYSSSQKGYGCYYPRLHHLFVSINVSFQEFITSHHVLSHQPLPLLSNNLLDTCITIEHPPTKSLILYQYQ